LIVKQIGRYFLAGSYVFLYLFGLSVFLDKAIQKTKWIVLYSPIIIMVFFVITLNPFDQIVRTEVIFRLFLGFPSAILASAAMLKMSGRFGALKLTKIVADFRGAAISFFFYAIFTGLFWVSYPKTILILGSVPVQLLRAITVIVLAYFTVRILGIFKLDDSN
ncbi:MAG: hypothetical protein QME63_10535, partial [Actinomycetota bacterium]|nr:hypothetical protein [Actinomycetota bacterium]